MSLEDRPRCLIGMSGAGKSYVSRILRDAGWVWHDCDLEIAGNLSAIVAPDPGEEPVHAVGRWMGMPWSEGYSDREQKYLRLEESATTAALDAAIAKEHVVDTTGSVIYLSETLLGRLRSECLVMYLRTPPSDYERMRELYLREPKPVVWGGMFRPRVGEAHDDALGRLYPELLRDRDARYLALAHEWVWLERDLDRDAALRLVRA
jgi:shikimate kinase